MQNSAFLDSYNETVWCLAVTRQLWNCAKRCMHIFGFDIFVQMQVNCDRSLLSLSWNADLHICFVDGLTTGGPVRFILNSADQKRIYVLTWIGPWQVTMVWGWFAVCIFTLDVGLALAGKHVTARDIACTAQKYSSQTFPEISSAYPTSGGLYWWAARLSTPRYAPVASWFSGWYNLIGQFAVTAGIDYGLALMISSVISVGQYGQWVPTTGAIVGIHVAICFSHGIANSMGPKVMRTINCK